MKNYILQLELLSPTLVGSGIGYGTNIDSDVVFDDSGIPFIPAKRIKGCLLDSIREVETLFSIADIEKSEIQIKQAFGKTGDENSALIYFSNLYIKDYEQNRAWLRYFLKSKNYKNIVTNEQILKTFTEIRQQTKIDNGGVAYEHSLRTIRVLNKGLTFYGNVEIRTDQEQITNTLLLACLNFRRFGTKRNRGFGEVKCLLFESGEVLSINKKLESLCIV
ncbi:MAG: CRISPR-associated protein [Acidobacteria bacterium]|nr:CRISPR-associated protein [Acidobacteriota bacterium]